MSNFFKSNSYFQPVYKHIDLPVYMTDEFRFFRCVEFNDSFYGKTISELHAGNLRTSEGRYSKLFPGQKISYWADLPDTSQAEIRKHGAGKNILTFFAYDDLTSTFPILDNEEPLVIIDGRKCGIQKLIDKVEEGKSLSSKEIDYMQKILLQSPDCLVYDSHARQNGENYIFLEKGFKKLALRQVKLRLGERPAKNSITISCADTSDYMPAIDNYACYFQPIARIGVDQDYYRSSEYIDRVKRYNESLRKLKNLS